jgi:hypothetical protein
MLKRVYIMRNWYFPEKAELKERRKLNKEDDDLDDEKLPEGYYIIE